MRRRDFTTALCVATSLPLFGHAQQRNKPFRVGFLGHTTWEQSLQTGYYKAFLDEMRRLGYVEGRDVIFEFAWAEGKPQRFPELAATLIKRDVDIIVAPATAAAMAAKRATTSKPIVVIAADVVELGFAQTLARPGGNITGIDVGGARITLKLPEILKQVVPQLTRMATLGFSGNPHWERTIAGMSDVARRLKVSIENILIDTVEALDGSFDEMARKGIEGLVVSAEPVLLYSAPRIANLALRHRMATAFFYTAAAEAGGLFAYETEVMTLFRRAAAYVDKILKGAAPGDLPIEFATRFKFTINLKTAKALGIKIPEATLAYADRVIE